ncbi:exported protein of unknown function [Paraburkholderia dioscoreae]|uniref:Porin domain-containing protein n=1 Tax=Paraburkholderia dioscoreae TaxID=2604047 RepID=A0A5Q4ZN03_9BURK|nr:exported protein of unknown function [Paraburkholderia dioscoreae]
MKLSMKKATVGVTCAGLAGFAAGAHAQSSVTLYGIVDAGVEYVNHASKDGGAARLVSGGKNTSRWGLRGVEDLGGGLKAVFQLESGINIANGQFDDSSGAIFDRRATIGLKKPLRANHARPQFHDHVRLHVAVRPDGLRAELLVGHVIHGDGRPQGRAVLALVQRGTL